MRASASLLLLLLASPSLAHDETKKTRKRATAQITDECHVARSSLREDRLGVIHFRPKPNARYEDVDCVLGKLKERLLVGKKPMAFVGNESYAPAGKKN